MGQQSSTYCACFNTCWAPRQSYHLKKQVSNITIASDADIQQPLVVEDESWKKWSSLNLIHSEAAKQEDQYHPPIYIKPQPAEAVWDL